MDVNRLEFAKQLLGQPMTPAQQRYFAEDPEMKIFSARSGSGLTTALVVDLVSIAVFEPGSSMSILCKDPEEVTKVVGVLRATLKRVVELRPELEWKSVSAKSNKFIIDYRCADTTVDVRCVSDEPKKKKVPVPSGAVLAADPDDPVAMYDRVYVHAPSGDMKRRWVLEAELLARDDATIVIVASTPQDADSTVANSDTSALDKVLTNDDS
jgi:hypothetical protein